MGKGTGIIPAMIAASLLAPAAAGADALCNHDDTVRMDSYLKKGREAEKSGRTRDALLFYRAIDDFCGDGDEARRLVRRMGLKYGAKAAGEGRVFSAEGLFIGEPDEDCRRWMRYLHINDSPYEPSIPGHCSTNSWGTRVEINPQAGAFDWYEGTFNHREADLALVALMEKRAGDIVVYDRVFRHFQARKRLNASGYSPDKAIYASVEKAAAGGLEATLVAEEKEYAASRQAEGSLRTLSLAMRWASYLDDAAKGRVAVRALARGAEAADTGTPPGLADAVSYFRFAGRDALASAVLRRANELGRAALEKNDYGLAESYFEAAGDARMAAAAREMARAAAEGAKTKP